MSWLDVTLKEPTNTSILRAKHLGLDTEIIEKVPAWSLIVYRISGNRSLIELWLDERFEARAAAMHKPAIRNTETPPKIALKNRKLRGNPA